MDCKNKPITASAAIVHSYLSENPTGGSVNDVYNEPCGCMIMDYR